MLKIDTLKPAGSFNFYSGSGEKNFTLAVNMTYSIDLDGDGLEEVIFSGFETQPNNSVNYSNTQISIFSWNNGKLQNTSDRWFPDNTNGIEGSGSISFGDFNGDGKIDMFSSAYTDMDYRVKSYAFYNTGQSFVRQDLGENIVQHDSKSADINNDGYSDVVVATWEPGVQIYLGSANGLIPKSTNSDMKGAGVALGNFLGDGSTSVIFTDHHPEFGRDTALFKFVEDGEGNINTEYIASLPQARFNQFLYPSNMYGSADEDLDKSHDVRAISLDFDSDGLLDVIVISRPFALGNQWPEYSELQFLKNAGSGNFVDVTDSTLRNYNLASQTSAAPKVADFNNDGLLDIFFSAESWDYKRYNSTSILMQKSDGTFVDSYRSDLSKLIMNGGGKAAIAKGPNDAYYLVTQTQLWGGITSVKYAKLSFSEIINGTAASEIFMGTGGNDKIDGAGGIDTIKYQIATSSVTIDLAKGKAFSNNSSLNAGIGTDTLKNIENAVGSDFNDALIGSKLANELDGGAGNDIIDGGLGVDTLIGGIGADRFVFSTKLSASNIDSINDFAVGEDQIQLSTKIFSKLKSAVNFFEIGAEANSSTSFIIYNSDAGTLSYDADGNGAKSAMQIAFIGQGLVLTEADFVIA